MISVSTQNVWSSPMTECVLLCFRSWLPLQSSPARRAAVPQPWWRHLLLRPAAARAENLIPCRVLPPCQHRLLLLRHCHQCQLRTRRVPTLPLAASAQGRRTPPLLSSNCRRLSPLSPAVLWDRRLRRPRSASKSGRPIWAARMTHRRRSVCVSYLLLSNRWPISCRTIWRPTMIVCGFFLWKL